MTINYTLYSGYICNKSGNFVCKVKQFRETPGYIDQVFMSSSGKNMALLVKKNWRKSDNRKFELQLRYQINLFEMAQQSPRPGSNYIKISARNRSYFAHTYILRIRAPMLEIMTDSNHIILRESNDSTVLELLEYIYLNTCQTFQVIEGKATEHSVEMLLNDFCIICRSRIAWTNCAIHQQQKCYQLKSLETIEKNNDLMETLENRLTRIISLCTRIKFKAMLECASKALSTIEVFTFYIRLMPQIDVNCRIDSIHPASRSNGHHSFPPQSI